jgi:phosphoribosylamine---glycine ligase
MKVLVIGSGGREHALAWKLKQATRVSEVFVAPGNGGTASEDWLVNVPITDLQQILKWATEQRIDLTVVGPELPLAQGIVDLFRTNGLRIFGPTQAAAQLESSKSFSKNFMKRHGIPTAKYDIFSKAEEAHDYVRSQGAPIVVKADGLAAGKGVVVALTEDEAHAAIDDILGVTITGGQHSAAGALVVIEEFLDGEEASFMVVSKGCSVCALATSQDHKRLLAGDKGPNTGGMGAYSPAPVVTPDVHARAMREVIFPTLRGMEQDGIPYTGFLYAGLMIDKDGQIKTLEFNCRMGDPETQPILMRLKSDLFELLLVASDDTSTESDPLGNIELQWSRKMAVGVVMAAGGYPKNPQSGDVISGIPKETDYLKVFHAGTELKKDNLITSGGRVLCVTALADSVRAAREFVHEAAANIQFTGKQYREDIGYRALKSKNL